MRWWSLGLLCCCGGVCSGFELSLNFNNQNSVVFFSLGDNLSAVASEWVASHPATVGAGCSDEACVVATLTTAMRSDLKSFFEEVEERYHNVSRVVDPRQVFKDARAACGSDPMAAESLAAIQQLDADWTLSGLEQVSGFCYMEGESRAMQYAASSRSVEEIEKKRRHQRLRESTKEETTDSLDEEDIQLLKIAARASHTIAAYAAYYSASFSIHALKFGALASLELSQPELAAWFSLRLAQAKRPATGSPQTPNPSRARIPWTINAPGIIEMDEDLEFRRAQFGGLHDAAIEFAANQYRWINETEISDQLFRLARETRRWREEDKNNEGPHHAPLDVLARRLIGDEDVNDALKVYGRLHHVSLGKGSSLVTAQTPPLTMTAQNRRRRIVREIDNSEGVVDTFSKDGVAVVDNFLTPEGLEGLREFVKGSTIFTRAYIQGYLGAFLSDGFGASPVVQQLADELRTVVFPELLGESAQLRQAWAYIYARNDDRNESSSHPRGIDAHADDADVSVNVWITEDEANLNKETGGLVIYEPIQPKNWTFEQANQDSVAIYDYLRRKSAESPSVAKESSSVRIPYRCNRATLLNGYRFHKTDDLHFKSGFHNHRINLTFLFKLRASF